MQCFHFDKKINLLFFRSFQTAVQIFQPDVVFILGDVFDEGNWVNDTQFQEYVDRFHTIFYVPENTKIYPIQGNHDINFHYAMHPHLVNRFNNAFNVSGVRLITERKITKTGDRIAVNFVTINSMALEGDGCYLCNQARSELRSIARDFEYEKARDLYSAPFVLQHFPTFRTSDENCIEKNSENNVKYREKWETLSKEASDYIAKVLKPRAYFSGHTHHYCAHKNEDDIFEFTVASFNWRNINNPSFLLGVFTPTNFSISKCDMPKEMTVIICYVIGCLLSLILATRKYSIFITKRNTAKME